MVLVILAMVWAAVLVPPMMRARNEGRPADSITSFRRQLHVLQRTNGAGPLPMPISQSPAHRLNAMTGPAVTAAARRRRTMKRRRDVFFGLLLAMGGSLLLGFIPSLRVMWGLHAVLDAVFVGYVAVLMRMRNLAAERDMKVRFLPDRVPVTGDPAPAPVLAFRRSGS